MHSRLKAFIKTLAEEVRIEFVARIADPRFSVDFHNPNSVIQQLMNLCDADVFTVVSMRRSYYTKTPFKIRLFSSTKEMPKELKDTLNELTTAQEQRIGERNRQH